MVCAEKLARCMPKAKYFPFMDQLFRNQRQWDPRIWRDRMCAARCCSRPAAAGMSEAQFDACIADTKQDAIINQGRRVTVMARYKHHRHPDVVID